MDLTNPFKSCQFYLGNRMRYHHFKGLDPCVLFCFFLLRMPRQTLPTNVTATHYKLNLVPAIDNAEFYGQVSISLTVNTPTVAIVCNAKELKIASASITLLRTNPQIPASLEGWQTDFQTKRHYQSAKSINFNPEEQTVKFDFEHEIPAESNLVFHLEFSGVHNDDMAGFYRSSFKDEMGNKKYMFVTQFEAVDCRRCFPCWDEVMES
jgi:aminopeptidase 2